MERLNLTNSAHNSAPKENKRLNISKNKMVQTGDNEPILATGGYDHTIKIWVPHSGTAIRTLQHSDSQVNVKMS